MDDKTVALCYLYRYPVQGKKQQGTLKIKNKGLSFAKIAALVKKQDGTVPTKEAVRKAVNSFGKEKQPVGRKLGWRKTTKAEDNVIMKTFKRLRPPGVGVDSRVIKKALPKQLAMKVCRRTIIRRLEERGYTPSTKISKTDTGPAHRTRRFNFAKAHEDKSSEDWKEFLQASGDLNEFTYYPHQLKPKHARLRASWTYMKGTEKLQPAFVRPKSKFRVLSFTNSAGDILAVGVTEPWDSAEFARLVRSKVGPWLQESFPDLTRFRILIDGEKVMHAADAKVALGEFNIDTLRDWPKYSPDLNPQENVWAQAEKLLRAAEKPDDTFETFKRRVLKACRSYPSGAKLIPSMATRMQKVIDSHGAMIKY